MALSTSEDFKLDLGVEPLRLLPIVSRLEDFVRPFCAALDAFHADWDALRKLRKAEHLPFYENRLREEHQLTQRKHHTGTSAFELGETG
ncbi:hypothetical protein D7X55_38940 [Corallococcus sp. AB049A]|uniref:hypothetical protein n=1 Tax=Corallococcus sp. AB049A TaxID=2316721 RepID=UPI000ED6A8E2|nr:hypothetical protein [Corallococcus sp. AB049A]RKI42909.1 hypothetical protein D7X55_38940 [Corallococcus sp. AB049A]